MKRVSQPLLTLLRTTVLRALAALPTLATVLGASLAVEALADDGTPVSFFALRPGTTARGVGLSGATVAFPADSELAFGNPATSVWQRGLIDLRYIGSTHKHAMPDFGSPNDAGKETGFTGAVSVKPFDQGAVSAGYASLRTSYARVVDPRVWRGVDTEALELPALFSARIHERISIGGGVSFSRRTYWRKAGEDAFSTTRTASQTYEGKTWRMGFLGAVYDTLSVGASYEAARSLPRGRAEGDTSAVSGKYVEPWTAKFGLCYLLFPSEQSPLQVENTFLLEANLMGWAAEGENALHPAGLGEESNARLAFLSTETLPKAKTRYVTSEKIVPRLGIQTMWFRSSNTEINTFVGAWFEPEYMSTRGSALHTSLGAEFSLWYFVVQAGADLARDEARTLFGAGIAVR